MKLRFMKEIAIGEFRSVIIYSVNLVT